MRNEKIVKSDKNFIESHNLFLEYEFKALKYFICLDPLITLLTLTSSLLFEYKFVSLVVN